LPVVAITAVGDVFDLSAIRSLGAEVLEKPVSAELELQGVVARIEAEVHSV
jgi:hypothetical protein